MFAVYDGHGGEEVALYCAKYLPDVIKNQQAYRNGKLQKALEDAFLSIDSKLTEELVIKELAQIAGRPQEDDGEKVADEDDVDHEEAALLHEEATMTIEELLTRYGQNQNSAKHAKSKTSPNVKKPPPKDGDKNKTEKEINGELESSEVGMGEIKSKNGKSEGTVGISSSSDCGGEEAGLASGDSTTGSGSDKEAPKASKGTAEEAVVSSSTADAGPSCSSSAKSQRAAKSVFFEDSEDESEEAEEEDSGEDCSEEEEYSSEEEEEDEEEEDEEQDDSDEAEEEDDIMLPGMDGKEEPGSDSGTTAVVALIRGKQLIVANAGDSRCVVSENGKAIDMSYDHKPEDEVELARIKNAGGKVTLDGRVNGGLNLSRAIGDHFYKRNKNLPPEEQMISALPDLKVLTLNDDHDFMVIACDGIWNVMSSQEVVDFISERINKLDENGDLRLLSSISEELLDQCLAPDTSGDGTGCDNMTCIIITFKPRPVKIQADCSKRKRPDSTDERENGKKAKNE
ncbi:protein phosphatase 1G isoform X2 [Carcharodon carcharias]|nr:protein phosphatase 1G isoform X2 [Carcharodon carcharias]